MNKIIEYVQSEPARVRLYSIAALVAVYLMSKGFISPVDQEFLVGVVGLVLAVENVRGKTTPADPAVRKT